MIDIVDDHAVAEEAWTRFHSVVRRRSHGGSKIIVISRTEAHSRLGTVLPISLYPPHREELSYFSRVLAFGTVDTDDHPDLARIVMTVCEHISDIAVFVDAHANVAAALLRADQRARSWRRVQKMYADMTMLQLDAAGNKAGLCYLCRSVMDTPCAPLLFYNSRKLIGMTRSELPKVRNVELLAGVSLPPTEEPRFDVLVWQSRIPPYMSYVTTCDMERARQVVAGEKRARKRCREPGTNMTTISETCLNSMWLYSH